MPMPEMKSVYSSHIQAIGYDPDKGELHVLFQNGKTGIYSGVADDLASNIMRAPSVGRALHGMIRNIPAGEYQFRYLDGQEGTNEPL